MVFDMEFKLTASTSMGFSKKIEEFIQSCILHSVIFIGTLMSLILNVKNAKNVKNATS